MADSSIDWAGIRTRRVQFKPPAAVFRQGDSCGTVLYLEQGSVRLSVVSHAGKEAVVAVLYPGDFFGEGCLAGQPKRIATATAVTPCTIIEMEHRELTRQLHHNPALAERFLSHMLTRNIRIEEDLIDHLFNDAEKRLARTLLLMARYGEEQPNHRTIPRVSQTILAEMVGTSRSRVNVFMNRFRKLGFIDYNGALKVNNSLLTVLLRDAPRSKSEMRGRGRARRAPPGAASPRS